MDSYVPKCCNISEGKSRASRYPNSGQLFPSTREKTFPPAIENRPIWMSNFRMNIFINMYRELMLSRLFFTDVNPWIKGITFFPLPIFSSFFFYRHPKNRENDMEIQTNSSSLIIESRIYTYPIVKIYARNHFILCY